MLDDLLHELNNEFERVLIQRWQPINQLLKLVNPPLNWNVGQLHVGIILVEGADRILHLAHQLLPIVGYYVAVLYLLKVEIVVLAQMDLELPYI